ncbi:MAG: hypothetical protein ACI8RD_005269, partial [Bacillariaceae sp.]
MQSSEMVIIKIQFYVNVEGNRKCIEIKIVS